MYIFEVLDNMFSDYTMSETYFKNLMQFSLCCKVPRCQIPLRNEKYRGNVISACMFATSVFVFCLFVIFFLNEGTALLQLIIT